MKRLLWIAFLSLTFACEKEDAELTPVDSVIQVEVKEALIEDSQMIILSCQTEKEYSCINFSIITDVKREENSFTVSFLGIDGQKICATAIGPANAEINFGALENGLYKLELNSGSWKNKGTLVVSDQKLVLDFPQQNGIEILTPSVQR